MIDKKKIVITGGTDGIGLAIAKELLKKNENEIIIIGKNYKKGIQLVDSFNAKNINFIQCDLSEKKEILELSKKLSELNKIDVLINNAGAMFSKRYTNSENIEKTFALNHLSYFHLSLYLLKKIENSPDGKIINVASNAHKRYALDLNDIENEKNYNGWKSYCRSKLLNLYFTYNFNKKLNTNVACNCLHPGFVNSNFGNNNISMMRFAINILKNFLAITCEKAAETPIELIYNNDLNKVTGKYFFNKKEIKSSKNSYDNEIADKVWDLSLDYHNN